MINFIRNPDRIRIDTDIIIIEADGNRITVPVVVFVKIENLEENIQSRLWRTSSNLFNKSFIIDKRSKPKPPKEPWWKLW